MTDVRLALEGAFDPQVSHAHGSGWFDRGRTVALAAGIVVIAALVGFVVWGNRGRVDSARVTRLQMPLPPGQDFYFTGRQMVAISPDGTQVAFTAGVGLWLRSLDQLDARQIPGTELEGRQPVFLSRRPVAWVLRCGRTETCGVDRWRTRNAGEDR